MGEGPTVRSSPRNPLAVEDIPSEWSSLNIHFMAAAGRRLSRLSEPRSSANLPQQQQRRWQRLRRLHDRRDFRLPKPSNCLEVWLPAPLARASRQGVELHVKGRDFRRRSPARCVRVQQHVKRRRRSATLEPRGRQ